MKRCVSCCQKGRTHSQHDQVWSSMITLTIFAILLLRRAGIIILEPHLNGQLWHKGETVLAWELISLLWSTLRSEKSTDFTAWSFYKIPRRFPMSYLEISRLLQYYLCARKEYFFIKFSFSCQQLYPLMKFFIYFFPFSRRLLSIFITWH